MTPNNPGSLPPHFTLLRVTGVSPTPLSINDDVFFNAWPSTATNGSFRWYFGDGAAADGVTATHQYAFGGTYTVT